MEKCKYVEKCPSATGWCNNHNNCDADCIRLIINQYNVAKAQYREQIKELKQKVIELEYEINV
jgi:hypothetical protein